MDVYVDFLQNFNLEEYYLFYNSKYNLIRYYFDRYFDLIQIQNDYHIDERYDDIQNAFVMNDYLIKIVDTEDCVRLYSYLFENIHYSFMEWINYNEFSKSYELFEIFIKNKIEKYLNIIFDILKYKNLNQHELSTSRIDEIMKFYLDIYELSTYKIQLALYDDIPTFLYLFKGCIFYMLEFNSYYKFDIGLQLNYMFRDYISPDIIFDYNCEYLYSKFEQIRNDIIYKINNEIIYYSSDSEQYDIQDDMIDIYEYVAPTISNSKEYYSKYLKSNYDICHICCNDNILCYICINQHTFSCIDCSTKIDKCPLCRYVPN